MSAFRIAYNPFKVMSKGLTKALPDRYVLFFIYILKLNTNVCMIVFISSRDEKNWEVKKEKNENKNNSTFGYSSGRNVYGSSRNGGCSQRGTSREE